ncbi:MAG: adenylyl-sulfate kinase [Rhizobacter sp.]|nr:adenylyl-sulfate kinase [Rhizobacter sp.]
MAHAAELIAGDIGRYLYRHGTRPQRFIICGNAGDGKRTLIGRLLRGSALISDDPLAAVDADADADAAVILVDARHGVSTQTRRHSLLLALIGVRHVVLAVNKMDLVDHAQGSFEAIVADCRAFAARIGIAEVTPIPVSALHGDNIAEPMERMPWYRGPTLMTWLETLRVGETRAETRAALGARQQPLRLPVQGVDRPDLEGRGCSGSIASGTVRPGERVRVLPSGREATVSRVVVAGGDRPQAVAGEAVTLEFEEAIDIAPGDLICDPRAPAEVADQFNATIVWMHEEPLLPGRRYLMKIGATSVLAQVTQIRHQINVDTLEHLAARHLDRSAIGECNLSLDRAVPFDAYRDNPDTGGFILIDRISNATVAAGMINFALRRAHNIHRQHVDVDKAARAGIKRQRPCVVWFTGLSGSGKSTVSNLVESRLHALGHHTYLLDGDNVRHGLNKDLGFTDADRVENIRRVVEVAKLMVDAGLIVMTAFISPFRAERRMARALLAEGEFIEVFMDTPLDVAEQRDPKGLYRKARRGELKNFTGIDSPYEAPEAADVRIDTATTSAEQAADSIVQMLIERGVLDAPGA